MELHASQSLIDLGPQTLFRPVVESVSSVKPIEHDQPARQQAISFKVYFEDVAELTQYSSALSRHRVSNTDRIQRALAAYSSLESASKKEYLSQVFGVDEFA